MLFAEYVDTKSALTLTVQLSKDYGDCGVTINQDSVALRTSLGAYRVEFSGLSIACVTCRNLEALSEEIMCCTFDATKKQSAHEPCKIISTVERLLVDGEALLCKFCQNDVAKIKHVKNFKLQPPAFSLEENCFASEESQFCHPDNSEEQKTHCIDLQLIEAFPDPTPLSRSNGLHSGVEVLLSSELIELESFKEQSGKYLHCSRCLIALGRKLTIGSSDQYVLWANCLDVLTEELDVDGAFLRHIEKPLLNEMDFYAMFIASLVENQCYRVIISAITWHGCVDFMLLWLIDQKVNLYSTTLPKSPRSPETRDDVNLKPKNPDTAEPSEPRFATLRLEPLECRRVFYRIVLTSDYDSHRNIATGLLKSWRHDFGVTLFSLPWETCVGLAACLQQSSTRIAPQFRKPGQTMAGFTCGAVPSFCWSSASC